MSFLNLERELEDLELRRRQAQLVRLVIDELKGRGGDRNGV